MSSVKKNSTLEKIINVALDVLIGIFCVILLITVYNFLQIKILHNDYSSFFGYSTFEVQTGSMKDAINIGDWIIVKGNDEYKLNDIVTYKQNGNYITHRIIEAYNDTYITKGDANSSEDNPINKSQIVGKTVSILPYFGIFRKTLFNPAVLIMLIVTLYLIGFAFSDKNKNNKLLIKIKEKLFNKDKPVVAVKIENKDENKVDTKTLLATLNESTEENEPEVKDNDQLEKTVEKEKEDSHEVMDEDSLNKTMCFRMIEVDASDIEEDNIELPEEEVIEQDNVVKKTTRKARSEKIDTGIDIVLLLEKYKNKKYKNFIDKTIFLKSEEIKNIILILTNTSEIKKNSIASLYIDSYIKARYYNNYLDTLRNVDLDKAISGVYNNICTSYKGTKTSYIKEAKIYKNLFSYIIKLDDLSIDCNKKELINKYNEILDSYFNDNSLTDDRINYILQNIYNLKKSYNDIIDKGLKNLDTDTFDLLFNRLSTRRNYFGLELKHNINFNKVYSDYIVDKVYTEGIIAEDKLIIIFTLLQIQLVNDMILRSFNKKYVAYFPNSLFEKELKLKKALKMIDDDYAKNSVIILLTYNGLLKHKQIVKKCRTEGYKFGVMFDDDDSIKVKDASVIGTLDLIFIDKKCDNAKKLLGFIPEDLASNIVYEDISLKIGNVKGE